MTNSVSLSSPFPIVPLPHLAKNQGSQSCYGSSVLTAQSKKRKRTEVAVAVDGQGVSILDVHATKVLSTYSLPPATEFSCAPVSVKFGKNNRRRTYAAVSHPKKQIVHWGEKATKRPGASQSTSIALSPVLSDYGTIDCEIDTRTRPHSVDSNVLRLDILVKQRPSSTTALKSIDEDLLAVYQNGTLQCLSSDLQVEKWLYKANTTKSKFVKTIFASVFSLALARKTILRNRPDVLAGVDSQPGQVTLLTISTPEAIGSLAELRLFAISPSSSIGTVRLLISLPFELPSQLKSTWDQAQISYHAPSGILHLLIRSSIASFSLIPTIPNLQSVMDTSKSKTSTSSASLIHVSSTNILLSKSSSIDFYDTKYGTIHASIATTQGHDSPKPKVVVSKDQVTLMLYLHDADLAIGYNRENIVGVQITRTRSFSGSTLLDSLCKGIETISTANTTLEEASRFTLASASQEKCNRNMTNRRLAVQNRGEKESVEALTKLRKAAKNKDVEGFEDIFADFIGVERTKSIASTEGANAALQLSQEASDFSFPDFTKNTEHTRLHPLTQPFVAAILRMLFHEDTSEGNGKCDLEIDFYASRVVRFLIAEGYFSCTSLPNHGKGIVKALVRHDPELGVLLLFLDHTSSRALPLEEVVQAIQVVLEQLVEPSLATNGTLSESASKPTNGMTDEEMLQVAAAEAEEAIDQLEHQIELNEVKEEILRTSLERINKFPRSAVIQSFRAGLGGAELAGLIRILRRELVRDGEGLPDEIAESPLEQEYEEEEWLGLICDTLTCALDAAGVTGLLLAKDTLVVAQPSHKTNGVDSAASEAVEVEELLLTSLSSEVSTACQSLEDASSLSVLVENLLVRAAALQAAEQPPSRKPATKQRDGVELKRYELEQRRRAVLPLGYPPKKAKNGKKTIERARAARTEKIMQSMNVGAYTLERLEI